jgi:hypothetical protein
MIHPKIRTISTFFIGEERSGGALPGMQRIIEGFDGGEGALFHGLDSLLGAVEKGVYGPDE